MDALPELHRRQIATSRNLMALFEAHRVWGRLGECRDRRHLRAFLEKALALARAGDRFMLHIVSHGSQDGLYVAATGEKVWCEQLTPILNDINAAMGGELVVNLTSCFGATGIQIVDEEDAEDPFFGLVGANREIGGWEAAAINGEFYRTLIATTEIRAAVAAVNSAFREKLLYAFAAVEFRRHRSGIRRGA